LIHVECAVPLNASRMVAWRVLSEKIEAPQRFQPRVVGCEVTGRGADEVVRRVVFDDGNAVTERVVLVPEEEVIFQFLDHPKFDGEIRHALFEVDEVLWLSFCFRGAAKPEVVLGAVELEQLRDGFVRAVVSAARQMADAERNALETT